MPYINEDRRSELSSSCCGSDPATAGELNYMITKLVIAFISNYGLNYETLATITGVLTNVKDELYRRVGIPYEDGKIFENGDVYPEKLTATILKRD